MADSDEIFLALDAPLEEAAERVASIGRSGCRGVGTYTCDQSITPDDPDIDVWRLWGCAPSQPGTTLDAPRHLAALGAVGVIERVCEGGRGLKSSGEIAS